MVTPMSKYMIMQMIQVLPIRLVLSDVYYITHKKLRVFVNIWI